MKGKNIPGNYFKINCSDLKQYADMLSLSRPDPSPRHPRMPVASRAKIFSPFSALRGYEEKLEKEECKMVRIHKKFLSEEDTERLSILISHIQKNMVIKVRYFEEDLLSSPLGTYREITGTVMQIDFTFRQLSLLHEGYKTVIYFEDLDNLELL